MNMKAWPIYLGILLTVACSAEDDSPRDITNDADLTPSRTPALSPCSSATDCQVSLQSSQCPCPEPMLATEDPNTCASPWDPADNNYALSCHDSFGVEQRHEPVSLCIQNECELYSGPRCEIFETFPYEGVSRMGVKNECDVDADCLIVNRFNPCGCDEAAAKSSDTLAPINAWTDEVMSAVWSSAELSCRPLGMCDCPPATGIACVNKACVLVD